MLAPNPTGNPGSGLATDKYSSVTGTNLTHRLSVTTYHKAHDVYATHEFLKQLSLELHFTVVIIILEAECDANNTKYLYL